MIGVEYVLLISTGLFSVILIVLLFVAGMRNKKSKKSKKKSIYLKKDLIDIKEQVSDSEEDE